MPPPLCAWVNSGVTDKDILLSSRRGLTNHTHPCAISFSTRPMHNILCYDRRLVDMRLHAYHLKKLTNYNPAEVKKFIGPPGTPNQPTEMKFDKTTKTSTGVVNECSHEIRTASNFKLDLRKHIHTRVGPGLDKIFAWDISPCCEANNGCIKNVYYRP